MNEDVTPAESERGCLSTPISSWWLLVPGVIIVLLAFMSQKRQPDRGRSDSRILGKGIAHAITQFYADHNRLPKPFSFKQDQDTDTDTSAAEGLIQIIRGKEPDIQTRQNRDALDYLEGMKAARHRTDGRSAEAKGTGMWVGGLVIQDGNLSAVDGWGGYYRIRLDTNYDGEMLNPNTDEVAEGRMKLASRVIVWSAGKDGKWDTWEDNVKSWD